MAGPRRPSAVTTAIGAARRLARIARARIRLATTRNPPLPAAVRSIVFVCKGNICRSPFAAVQAERILRELGRSEIRCLSAGLKPSQADACPPDAIAAAAARGHDLSAWRPVALTDEAMAATDLVVVMETLQLDAVHHRWPAHRHKTLLLSLYGGDTGVTDAWARLNIADPFDRGRDAFERCYGRLDAALRDLCSRLPTASHDGDTAANRHTPKVAAR
jgi:protein-tyrosine phosphatase